MISYAQNFEDVMLWRALKHIPNGFYIDVGAWSPDIDSVTRHFYEQGWRGINIEPNSNFSVLYQEKRPQDITLEVAISTVSGNAEFYFSSNPGLSSLDEQIAKSHEKIGCTITSKDVNTVRLDTICDQYCSGKDIHFLKVDVEGLEKQVLLSNSWGRHRPWIIVVEATKPMSQIDNYDEWESILLEASYEFVYADGLNRFYVAKEHADLKDAFKYPPNVFDEFVLVEEVKLRAQVAHIVQESEILARSAEKQLKEQEALLEKVREAYENSLSWKLTKPLRVLKQCWFKKGLSVNISDQHHIQTLENELQNAKYDIKKLHRHIYLLNKTLSESQALNIPLKVQLKQAVKRRLKKLASLIPLFRKKIEQYEQARAQEPFYSWVLQDQQRLSPLSNRRLVFISPLPPARSGIADYSLALLADLKEFYDITVVCENEEVRQNASLDGFTTILADEYMHMGNILDRHLYHFGNSFYHLWMEPLLERYPGTVVLHDIYLGGYTSVKYRSQGEVSLLKALYEEEGYKALQKYMQTDLYKTLVHYPMNQPILRQSDGIIVHSEFAALMLPDTCVHKVAFPKKLPTQNCSQKEAKRVLGIDGSEFLVCTFGFIGPSKCSQELIEAWQNSILHQHETAQLIFVGSLPESPYGQTLKTIADNSNIVFTGYCSQETYQMYLAAADVVVQLRQNSRGESSAALFDALSYGKPTIINAHGSFIEIPHNVAKIISEYINKTELTEAIETLYYDESQRTALSDFAIAYMREHHSPRYCAHVYYDAIESNYMQGQYAEYRKALMEGKRELIVIRSGLYKKEKKSLFVDVSDVANHDLRTGIQRVVRSILRYLLEDGVHDYRIEPVKLVNGQYIHAREFTLRFLGQPFSPLPEEPIEPKKGDIFLGLDHYIGQIGANPQIFKTLSDKGVTIWFVMYDLLPIQFPHFFPETSLPQFERWLDVIATYAHGVACISKTVADEFSQWFTQQRKERSIQVEAFPLGYDIDNSHPSIGISEEENQVMEFLKQKTIVLMVGTIEPRKGHSQALDALEVLWNEGKAITLVIVGKKGWMVEETLKRIKKHPLLGTKLFWFEQASDELLMRLYEKTTFLLVASQGEGYGLPIIEAAQKHIPILARDIPVFREVGAEYATFFKNTTDANALAKSITTMTHNKILTNASSKITTWKQSSDKLFSTTHFIKLEHIK